MEVNELYCIGSNKYGEAGAGKKYYNQEFNEPKPIVFPTFSKQVACGAHHSSLLTIEGRVYMMGSNINGALGLPTSTNNYSYSPILLDGLTNVSKICSGYYHMMALVDGTLYSWGKGIDGQLGIGKHTSSYVPTKIQSLGRDVQDVACGSNHTIIKNNQGKCYAFGNGMYGQLGVGNNKNFYDPVPVKIQHPVNEFAAGENFSLFLCEGRLYGVGDNSCGQIDHSLKRKCILEPIHMAALKDVAVVRAGRFAAALTHEGEVLVWGFSNEMGIIRVVGVPEPVTDIEIGGHSLYCLTSAGKLFCHRFSLKQKNEVTPWLIPLPTSTILGMSVGQNHAIILGDICGEIPILDEPPQILQPLNESDSLTSSKMSKMASKSKLMEQFSSEGPSISIEHLARTPSSIMREPNNFFKEERKQATVTDFSVKESTPKAEYLRKIDEVMNLLSLNRKMEENMVPSAPLSRRQTRSQLASIINKQNRDETSRTDRGEKGSQHKALIMELREKELKISELQEKLSRKEIQIETQRQLIDLMRKAYPPSK